MFNKKITSFMNYDEKIAYEYLTQNYTHGKIRFEPDGNRPPDFSINKETAIEVRRLNQNYVNQGRYKGLEELEYSLIPKIINVLKEFETKEYETSVLVNVYYRRPIKVNKKLIKTFREKLKQQLPFEEKSLMFKASENLFIKLTQSSLKLDRSILRGGVQDYDSGGFVLAEMERNIKLVLPEKEERIKEFYQKYNSWWLFLVDHIGYGIEESEFKKLKSSFKAETIFDKIQIISPLNIEKKWVLMDNIKFNDEEL